MGLLFVQVGYHRELSARLDHWNNAINRSSNQFFVRFGQFAPYNDVTIPGNSRELGQGGDDSMWSLEEDHDASPVTESLEPVFSVFTPRRRESKEGKALDRQPRH